MAGSVGKTGPPGFDDPGSIVVIVAVLDGETGALPASDNRGFIIISIVISTPVGVVERRNRGDEHKSVATRGRRRN